MTMTNLTNNSQAPVDLEFLRTVTDHDNDFEKDLLKIFIQSADNDVGKMEKSLGNPRCDDWYLSSHSFKGAAASMGAFSLAKSLEYAQFHKDDPDDKKLIILAEIKTKLKIVIDFLTKEFKA